MTGVSAAELAAHDFLRGLRPAQVERLADAAVAVAVPAGHRFFEEGGRAAQFWLITSGHVALDLHVPGKAPIIIETLGRGDVVGLSWASPPREWQFGADAVQPTEAFEFDADEVIGICEGDHELGYQLARRLLAVASGRMHWSRIRMLDLYGSPEQRGGMS
ncbi:MAG TPA: cyclic nucleotide-binding domain-containing protein [Streptosporangiaceae bacterium]|nr:cyclic nucleotide-binding domain-containing protein [Streptosporangiaceae bacterium]